jgi:hypothetical protein
MDKLDRNLNLLPRPIPAADLSSRISRTLIRRHRVRRAVRRSAAAGMSLAGLLLALPAFAGSSPDFFSSAVPWLSGSLGMFEMESVQVVLVLWNEMVSLQSTIQSTGVVSAWPGILLMGAGLAAGLDRRVFQAPALDERGIRRV